MVLAALETEKGLEPVSPTASCFCLPNLSGRFRFHCRLYHPVFPFPLVPYYPTKQYAFPLHACSFTFQAGMHKADNTYPLFHRTCHTTSTISKTLTKQAAKKPPCTICSYLPPKHGGHSSRMLRMVFSKDGCSVLLRSRKLHSVFLLWPISVKIQINKAPLSLPQSVVFVDNVPLPLVVHTCNLQHPVG